MPRVARWFKGGEKNSRRQLSLCPLLSAPMSKLTEKRSKKELENLEIGSS